VILVRKNVSYLDSLELVVSTNSLNDNLLFLGNQLRSFPKPLLAFDARRGFPFSPLQKHHIRYNQGNEMPGAVYALFSLSIPLHRHIHPTSK